MPVFVLTHHKCASTWLMAWLEAVVKRSDLTLAAASCFHRTTISALIGFPAAVGQAS